jgi:preprotein translocase subunit SecA
LLEYDDVMNAQREMIYKRRKHALFGERLKVDLDNMIYDTCEELISMHKATEDFEAFRMETIRVLSVDPPFDKEELKSGDLQVLSDQLYQEALAYYKRKSDVIVKRAFPVIKDVYDKRGDTVQNIIIPFTDQIKVLNARANLEKIIQSAGTEVINEFEKSVTLSLIDESWKENLRQMDDLKQSVQSAVYEQKDPLLIYKFEAFELFKEMLYSMNKDIIAFLFRADIPLSDPDQVQRAAERKRGSIAGTQTSRKADDIPGQPQQPIPTGGEPRKRQPVKAEEKVGRNDPCPCGSGKKYKKCHGAPGKVPVS